MITKLPVCIGSLNMKFVYLIQWPAGPGVSATAQMLARQYRAATTRLNMFSGQQISFLQLNYINRNLSTNNITLVAPW